MANSKPRFYILYHRYSPSFYVGDELFIESVAIDSKTTGSILMEKIRKKTEKINTSLKEKGRKITLEFKLVKHSGVEKCLRGQELCFYHYGLEGCGEFSKYTSKTNEIVPFITKKVQEYIIKRPIQQSDREKFECLRNLSMVRLYPGSTLETMSSDELYLYVYVKTISLGTRMLVDIGEFQNIDQMDECLKTNQYGNNIQFENPPKNVQYIDSVLSSKSCEKIIYYFNSDECTSDFSHGSYNPHDLKKFIDNSTLEKLISLSEFNTLKKLMPSGWTKIIIRKNIANPNEWIPFHLDHSKQTCQVFLNGEDEYQGGKTIYKDEITEQFKPFRLSKVGYMPRRILGNAIVHTNKIQHAVIPITKGIRYGLFLLDD